MGIFDGIIGAVAGPIIGGIFGSRGQESANAANIEQSQENRDFQERMRATQYQTAVKDMEAAGLNPMLAYGQGGAGTPSGSQSAPIQNKYAAGAATAAQIASTRVANATEKLMEAQAVTEAAKAKNVDADTAVLLANEPNVRQMTLTSASQQQLNETQRNLTSILFDKTQREIHLLEKKHDLTEQEIRLVNEQVNNAILEGKNIEARTGNTKVDTVLRELEIPLAKNLAEAEKSGWKRNVAPYLNDAGKVTGSAAALRYGIRGGGARNTTITNQTNSNNTSTSATNVKNTLERRSRAKSEN